MRAFRSLLLLVDVLVGAPRVARAQRPGLTGTLVVTNRTPATATVIDVASGRALATLPTGQGPHEIALSSDGRTAVVTDYGGPGGGRTLTVIDVPALRVARTSDLGEYRRPHGVAFLPGDGLVAVTSEASQHVVIVDPHTGAVRRAIPTRHAGSHMLGVTRDAARIYTGDIGSNTVSELDVRAGAYVRSVDVATRAVVGHVPAGETPDGVAYTPAAHAAAGRQATTRFPLGGRIMSMASSSSPSSPRTFMTPHRRGARRSALVRSG